MAEVQLEQTAADIEDDDDDDDESDDNDQELTGTVVRRRREANAFLGEPGSSSGVKGRYTDDDGYNWDDDEYIGLIPMLCARCSRQLRKTWTDQRCKRCIVVVNVILSLCGCLLVCIGLWMLICQDSLFYGVLLTDNATSPVIVMESLTMALLSVGFVLFFIAFIGACGACTECICFLGFHMVMAIGCVATQLIFAIVAASLKNTVNTSMAASLQHQIRYQYNISGSRIVNASSLTYRVTSAWDQLQQQLECCGSVGPSDYHYSSWFNHTPDSDGSFVPLSCCAKSSLDSVAYHCQFEAVAFLQHEMSLDVAQLVRTLGCYDAILNLITDFGSLIAFIIILIDFLITAVLRNKSKKLHHCVKSQSIKLNIIRYNSDDPQIKVHTVTTWQIVDVIYCCLLIRIARRKQSDYTWCDDDVY